MRPYFTHTLEIGREEVFTHSPGGYLAIVDLESYPAFAGKNVDHLDMMAHLSNQMSALTAMAWGTLNETLRIRLLLTGDHRAMEQMIERHQQPSASGWVRTHNGQLCFISRDQLYDCAQHRSHDLLDGKRVPREARPHVLNVPPGIYSGHVFDHAPSKVNYGVLSAEPAIRSTVILRHYAFPAPRVAPPRLSGGLIPWAGEAAASQPWGGRKAA